MSIAAAVTPRFDVSELSLIDRYRVIGKPELRLLVPYCDQHIRRLEKAGKFPKRLQLGENRVGWYLREVLAWIASREVRDYPATDDDVT